MLNAELDAAPVRLGTVHIWIRRPKIEILAVRTVDWSNDEGFQHPTGKNWLRFERVPMDN
jgi:hypothetical protein